MKMLTKAEVAEKANVPQRTIQDWATDWVRNGIGHGPRPFRLAPQTTRYRLDEVDEWINDPAGYHARFVAAATPDVA